MGAFLARPARVAAVAAIFSRLSNTPLTLDAPPRPVIEDFITATPPVMLPQAFPYDASNTTAISSQSLALISSASGEHNVNPSSDFAAFADLVEAALTILGLVTPIGFAPAEFCRVWRIVVSMAAIAYSLLAGFGLQFAPLRDAFWPIGIAIAITIWRRHARAVGQVRVANIPPPNVRMVNGESQTDDLDVEIFHDAQEDWDQDILQRLDSVVLAARLLAAQATITKQAEALHYPQTHIWNANHRASKLERENKALHKQLKDAEELLRATKSNHEDHVRYLRMRPKVVEEKLREIKDLKREHAEQGRNCVELAIKNKLLKLEVKSMEKNIEDLRATVAKKSQKLDTLSRKNTAKDYTFERMKRESRAQSSRLSDLNAKISDLETQLSTQTTALAQEETRDSLTQILLQIDAEISHAESDLYDKYWEVTVKNWNYTGRSIFKDVTMLSDQTKAALTKKLGDFALFCSNFDIMLDRASQEVELCNTNSAIVSKNWALLQKDELLAQKDSNFKSFKADRQLKDEARQENQDNAKRILMKNIVMSEGEAEMLLGYGEVDEDFKFALTPTARPDIDPADYLELEQQYDATAKEMAFVTATNAWLSQEFHKLIEENESLVNDYEEYSEELVGLRAENECLLAYKIDQAQDKTEARLQLQQKVREILTDKLHMSLLDADYLLATGGFFDHDDAQEGGEKQEDIKNANDRGSRALNNSDTVSATQSNAGAAQDQTDDESTVDGVSPYDKDQSSSHASKLDKKGDLSASTSNIGASTEQVHDGSADESDVASPTTVVVKNLDPNTHVGSLCDHFRKAGGDPLDYSNVQVIPTITAHIKYANRPSAENVVLTHNDRMYDGQLLNVSLQDDESSMDDDQESDDGHSSDSSDDDRDESDHGIDESENDYHDSDGHHDSNDNVDSDDSEDDEDPNDDLDRLLREELEGSSANDTMNDHEAVELQDDQIDPALLSDEKGGSASAGEIQDDLAGEMNESEPERENVELYIVIAKNFAPGTKAEDIEAMMDETVGEVLRCVLLSSKPIIAEITFARLADAKKAVLGYNSKNDGGNKLEVYRTDRQGADKVKESIIAARPKMGNMRVSKLRAQRTALTASTGQQPSLSQPATTSAPLTVAASPAVPVPDAAAPVATPAASTPTASTTPAATPPQAGPSTPSNTVCFWKGHDFDANRNIIATYPCSNGPNCQGDATMYDHRGVVPLPSNGNGSDRVWLYGGVNEDSDKSQKMKAKKQGLCFACWKADPRSRSF